MNSEEREEKEMKRRVLEIERAYMLESSSVHPQCSGAEKKEMQPMNAMEFFAKLLYPEIKARTTSFGGVVRAG